MHTFSTPPSLSPRPPKYQKTLQFSDVFKGYWKNALATYGLI